MNYNTTVVCRYVTLTTDNILYILQPTLDNPCGVRICTRIEGKYGNISKNEMFTTLQKNT